MSLRKRKLLFIEAAVRRCSSKKVPLKISQYSQENKHRCWSPFFDEILISEKRVLNCLLTLFAITI